LPGLSATSSVLGRLGLGITSDNSFAGKGSSVNSNAFSGTITATVIECCPTATSSSAAKADRRQPQRRRAEVLRQIDPMTIQSGNTVASTQIANVRIEPAWPRLPGRCPGNWLVGAGSF